MFHVKPFGRCIARGYLPEATEARDGEDFAFIAICVAVASTVPMFLQL
jgi:hypothetical protein